MEHLEQYREGLLATTITWTKVLKTLQRERRDEVQQLFDKIDHAAGEWTTAKNLRKFVREEEVDRVLEGLAKMQPEAFLYQTRLSEPQKAADALGVSDKKVVAIIQYGMRSRTAINFLCEKAATHEERKRQDLPDSIKLADYLKTVEKP